MAWALPAPELVSSHPKTVNQLSFEANGLGGVGWRLRGSQAEKGRPQRRFGLYQVFGVSQTGPEDVWRLFAWFWA